MSEALFTAFCRALPSMTNTGVVGAALVRRAYSKLEGVCAVGSWNSKMRIIVTLLGSTYHMAKRASWFILFTIFLLDYFFETN